MDGKFQLILFLALIAAFPPLDEGGCDQGNLRRGLESLKSAKPIPRHNYRNRKFALEPVCLRLSDPVHKFSKLQVLASGGQGLELHHLFT
jgi:hypothetical protein